MSKTITLREANRGFARHVRADEMGEEFLITRNGASAARLVPATVGGTMRQALSPVQQAALARTRARMAEGWPIGAGPRRGRADLHER